MIVGAGKFFKNHLVQPPHRIAEKTEAKPITICWIPHNLLTVVLRLEPWFLDSESSLSSNKTSSIFSPNGL